MRILHVIPSVSDIHGGPSTAIVSMTTAIARLGVDVHIATSDDNGKTFLNVPLGRPNVQDQVTYWYFHRQTSFYKFSWPLTMWLLRHVADYDIIHIHALFSYAALPASFLAVRGRVPFVLRPLGTLSKWSLNNHHKWIKQLSYHLVERNLIAHASLMHYTSDAERSEAFELGVKRPYAIIPIGVDLSNQPRDQSEQWLKQHAPNLVGRQIILFLSRLDHKKGLNLLLPAFARLRAQGPKIGLVIAGDGDSTYVRSLQSQARDLGIGPDVCWAGHLRGESKKGAFAAAHVFVLPSYSENFGIAVVEAMAAGLPVIVSDQVGIHKDLVRVGAGISVPCRSDRLAVALAELIDNPIERSRMGLRARSFAEQNYSMTGMANKLMTTYSEVLGSKCE